MPDISKIKIAGVEYDIKDTTARGNTGGSDTGSGGYYTPVVTQQNENTMRVGYTPSKADMPAVPEVNVTLPSGEPGQAATIEIVGTETLEAGQPAAVEEVEDSTPQARKYKFKVPQGKDGEVAPVDSTLTQEGQAADAKAVGDKFSELSEEIANQNSGSGKTALDAFIDNTDIDYLYDETTGAYYTVIRVYKQKLDGSYQYPFVYAPNGAGAGDKSTYDMTVEDGWLLAINSGIFNTSTKKPDGIVIQNSTVVQNTPSATYSQCKPLTIDSNGDLGFAAYDADAEELVASGIVSAVCGFMPIVVDYTAVDSSEWNSVSHYIQNAQRQIIGQWGNGDYAIITCEGRSYHNSDGWTIAEAQAICVKHGLKFAYNLDGGGSTETMLGLKHINTIYENTTGRVVPTFIVFNGETGGDDSGSGEIEKTLTSISATYSGGSVAVGTALADLTGIVVTALYSDDTSETVTGYTLSGTIAEGSNTITVSYGGKTTTFIVTGVTEEPDTTTYTIINNLTNVATSNSAASVEGNTAYTATLTAASGYELGAVTVTMGGVDVTATAYSGGVVAIASVTGNVVITATGILADTTEWAVAENVVIVTSYSFNTSEVSLGIYEGRACALSTEGTVQVQNNTDDGKTYYGIPVPSTATKVKIALAECGGTPAPIFLNERNGTLSLAKNVGWQAAMGGIDGVYEFAAATYDYFACNFKGFGSATDTIKIYFA